MSDTETAEALRDVREAVSALTVALARMLAAQARQTDMLKEILAAVTAEPTDESPLQEALRTMLAKLVEIGNTADRIEATLNQAVHG